jgi:serine/threonine-protein kinase
MGAGGMGAVYRGTQLSIDRPVAIKLIAPEVEQNAAHVQRFRREAEALARLRHPNTVHLLDFGVTEQGRLYMVMELLSGTDLEQRLAQHGTFELAPALRVVRQIARALSEAHATGIIHRDLKPSNVFLSQVEGGDTFVKVMDFGVAGFQQAETYSTLTLQGTVLGTAAYMSPEQAQGFAVDARADLYSLGVVLFEMLSGRPPFQANSAVSLLLAHVSEEPPRLREVCPDLLALQSTQDLLDKLLAKDPEQRLHSATELIDGIDDLLLEIGEASLPPTGSSRIIPRKPRRHTAWYAVALTLMVSGFTGLALQRPHDVSALRAQAGPSMEMLQLRGASLGRAALERVEELLDTVRGRTSVTIATVPSGAIVKLAGAELGKTPYALALKTKTEVELDLPGHALKTLAVDPGGDPNLVVKLEPLPPYLPAN